MSLEALDFMLLVIDNYDSFTYNLVQYFGELGIEPTVYRNDQISVEAVAALSPQFIVISPGPKGPADAGISCEIIDRLGPFIPILGVCLGHQCIGHVYGAKVVRAKKLMHGKTSFIHHNGEGIFWSLPNPFEATRYHSLIVEKESIPSCLHITAWTEDDEVMGLSHEKYPVFGVQFHPESILTREGKRILKNFLSIRKQHIF
ncbi:bifunctional protein:(Includes: para-aminobenzoate synthase glutamine amidotransferase component II (ADC synthase); anthranilate synthase component II) [Methylacidiphilum fumariolicum SolV]|uniref:Bifunctional protein n=3 Tax=Candidatus Methylacidiphilum fumarolicum TaxID=591154 RepID=I0K031_METFB|nr:aminodeoxychorismate/anthranilate synthase component II [Candidatus Methylacidiphilum fumarolicum]CAI9085043.1 aminodeoxychorismate synthase subunit 2 [Candidatus Methylacidiphilum fumarolicum]CCG92850.1 bifunctional protein:(Includes: para-aminobenzoate synthase glutamine amidotransferase component II (ADC synthase); anthranilate synthase component II) [Methylacidiphilum fumariolicum SolV]